VVEAIPGQGLLNVCGSGSRSDNVSAQERVFPTDNVWVLIKCHCLQEIRPYSCVGMVNESVSKRDHLKTSAWRTLQTIQIDGRSANHSKDRLLYRKGMDEKVCVWHIGSKKLNALGVHKIVCIKEGDNVCSNDRQSLISVLGLVASVLSCEDGDRERIVCIR
jgi:hypothetical protein